MSFRKTDPFKKGRVQHQHSPVEICMTIIAIVLAMILPIKNWDKIATTAGIAPARIPKVIEVNIEVT